MSAHQIDLWLYYLISIRNHIRPKSAEHMAVPKEFVIVHLKNFLLKFLHLGAKKEANYVKLTLLSRFFGPG